MNDPKLTDLQNCNEALGRKYEILKTAMEQIKKGSPFAKDIAITALKTAGAITFKHE